MKYGTYNAQELEPQILSYWKHHAIVEKQREKNKNGKKFYFLDGPPYTSGKFHLGHAWNYALKDIVLRYKRMQGLNVWDRNGFDVHGLPTEHKVMDRHNLKTKEDIEKFGVDTFIKECESFCLEMADLMTKDLARMGVTFDISHPYMALKTEFMEGEWDLIKKAYEKERLYHGEKVLTWCQHCETAVAKHECEYQNITDKSIFVKFSLKGKKDEYLLIWTTTPWTIPFNLAVMAGPDIDYLKIEVDGEKWILAKALAGVIIESVAGKRMKVLEEMKGKNLEGLEYVHPFAEHISKYAELKKKHPHVHTVILNEQYVDTTSGTGLVHAAPGCGPEDQEACKPYDIPPFNSVGEDGFFPKEMGKFTGWRAKIDDPKFIAALEEENAFVAKRSVKHEYPHCWRCKHPVIFRITYQWFFKVEDMRDNILKGNKEVHWVPDTALHAYESWISNLRDNSITRQRYWGTPVPIWQCEKCDAVKVIGSRQEIEELGGKVPENIHKPWIDEVTLKCTCKGKMKRVPDIIDVWVDAGTASWNCLGNDPEKMDHFYPADMILEAREQTRLWFSMLSICSYLYLGQNAFKNVYVYGMLLDIEGRKMSKSIGNIISPYELIDKHGVDVLRFYMCQNTAGQDINFSWDECKVKSRELQILWNVHKLLISLCHENNINPSLLDDTKMAALMGSEERYILSKLNSTIKKVTALMEGYQIDQAIAPLEELFLELSRTYIQMVRDKSSLGSEEEKQVVIYTIYKTLLEFCKMFHVFVPFISEAMYLNLREEFGLKKESISHYLWPVANEKRIDAVLEQEMVLVQQIIAGALHAREKANLGVRWPVKELAIVSTDGDVIDAAENGREILMNQTNAKSISIVQSLPGVHATIKPNYSKIGPAFGPFSPQVILALATESAAAIVSHFEKEEGYIFQVEGREVKITPEMVAVETTAPKNYTESAFKNGVVYLNTERNKELDTEGYVRELMRQVQELRKNAGLEKQDRIVLYVKTTKELKENLQKFHADIQEKVGADTLKIETIDPARKHQHTGEFAIKKETFKVWFDKI